MSFRRGVSEVRSSIICHKMFEHKTTFSIKSCLSTIGDVCSSFLPILKIALNTVAPELFHFLQKNKAKLSLIILLLGYQVAYEKFTAVYETP